MNIFLLIFSILIYASFGISNLLYIFMSAFSTFLASQFMNQKNRKIILWLTIALNLGVLIFFKLVNYNSFFHFIKPGSILVPLGVSYYTFQVLGYLIDIYRGSYPPEKNIWHYLLFVCYIPYLFIGPISRYDDFRKNILRKHKFQAKTVYDGILRILIGILKQLVIARRISIIIATITSNTNFQGAYVLYALILYSFQLYSDFSGGIDIVLGVSHLFGIDLPENFDRPFLAVNVRDFWHRWHMTLSSWLKDYVYIPLGGSHCSKIRTKLNVVITFIVSGLWHGFSYFFWGLIHGIIVAFTPKKDVKYKKIHIVFTFLIVSLLWVFFIYPNSLIAFRMLLTIFYQYNYLALFSNFFHLGLDVGNMVVLIGFIFLLMIQDIKKEQIKAWIQRISVEKKMIMMGFLILTILVFGVYGLGFEANDFIYSQF